ncbi:acyl-CoA Delta-9 desaturase-like [Chrysoperla carnea]|uniref:acyl-CoA Delta-9 desaturase-like n=1 Tax=Chrysoperla carnea TaxID=189513 RepID=UPI001D07F722|nr:acyl-CoA Delta-9 desaturase-like [Chrysoperla carnea]
MSRNPKQVKCVLNGKDNIRELSGTTSPTERKYKYRWTHIVLFGLFHIQAIYGMYLSLTSAKLLTNIFAYVLSWLSGFSLAAAAHRLWSHHAYKATWQLKLIFMLLQTMAFQESLYLWCRNHRMHHKFLDTDADPHNSRRGFFYSHIGWLIVEPHPEYMAKRKLIDMSDLKKDPFIRFQIRYYYPLLFLLCFLLPTIIPWYYIFLRYILVLNSTCLANSWAHIWGTQPYEKGNSGRNSFFMSLIAMGEGWHNYHHTFPWDYRTSELGGWHMTPIVVILNLLAKVGWVYDMKTVSNDMILKRIQRTGDGSHPTAIWGWGDLEQSKENKSFCEKKKLTYMERKNSTQYDGSEEIREALNTNTRIQSNKKNWKATKRCNQPLQALPPLRNQERSWARSNKEKADLFAQELKETFSNSLDAPDEEIEQFLSAPLQLSPPIEAFSLNEI